MKLCLISDIHGTWNKVTIPECDILISCGDYSFRGEPYMVKDFHRWLNKQNAKYVISVQGNHEKQVEQYFNVSKQIALEACPRVNFIDEGLIEIDGVKIWCSAITPFFHNWAWNRYRGDEIKKHWDKIPNDIDVLITHGPPAGVLDKCPDGRRVGCDNLYNRIYHLKNLKMHAFGHIHDSYGTQVIGNVTFINASICNEEYKATNLPITYELTK